MTRSLFLFAAGFALVWASCRKNDLPGPHDLKVHCTRTNDIDGSGIAQPCSACVIHVTQDASLESYLFTATTDGNGNAVFVGLNAEKYFLFAYERPTSGLHFNATAIVQGDQGNADLDLRAGNSTTQNGFLITTKDANGNPVANLTVCVHTTLAAALQDGCPQGVLTGTTDAYGRVSKTGVPAGTYYARISNPGQFVNMNLSFTVAEGGIVRQDVVVDPGSATGYKVLCLDAMNQLPLPGVRVCGYVNPALVDEECSIYAFFSGNALNTGWYTNTGLAPGVYHLRFAADSLGIDTVLPDPITIVSGQVLVDTVLLQ